MAFAYPEMIRNGYNNCAVCHYSQNGGGLINAYGRQLSREVLSTWGLEGEEQFLYGIVKPPEWLAAGGDFRFVQLHRDTDAGHDKKFIMMQADAEAAITYKKIFIDGTAGYEEKNPRYAIGPGFVSRRHYINFQATDELAIRGGKFLRDFGINTAEHTIATKRPLKFDESSETYNLEFTYLTESWSVSATGVFGLPNYAAVLPEKGAAAVASHYFNETYKVGGSYYYGTSSQGSRNLFGPWAILGFTPHFYLLSEFDFQQQLTPQHTFGSVNYQRLGYEVVQGLHLFITQEHQFLDWEHPNQSFSGAYGAGMQFFPRPHFDIQTYFQAYNVQGQVGNFDYWYWLMFHYYL